MKYCSPGSLFIQRNSTNQPKMKVMFFAVLVMLGSACLSLETWSVENCTEECFLHPEAECRVICWYTNAVDIECQNQHFICTERVICLPS